MKLLSAFILLICCLQSVAQTSDSYGDNDGDGIRNALDKCPSTLKGIAVDMHGCPKDTDGDGVADYLDKQLITPTECQPSDADGIGECPCMEGCGEERRKGTLCCVSLEKPVYINFRNSSYQISEVQMNELKKLSQRMMYVPNCTIVLRGYVRELNNKKAIQLSWLRCNEVKKVMSNKFGIDKDRFIFKYKSVGPNNLVVLMGALEGDTGPSNAKSPFPELNRYFKQ